MSALANSKITNQLPHSTSETPGEDATSNVRQLRLLARKKTTIAAFATCDGTIFPIEIRNISIGGAGIQLGRAVPNKATLSIHLATGRTIAAVIIWMRFGFCGAEFETPLAEDDELLMAASTARPGAQERMVAAELTPDSSSAELASGPVSLSATNKRLGFIQDAVQSASVALATAIQVARQELGCNRHQRMIEQACRKQGYAWLVDEEQLTEPDSRNRK